MPNPLTPADLAAIEERTDEALDIALRERSWLEAEVRRLQADNERMRRGLVVAVERGKQNTPFGACVIAENLLAGREWNESEGK